LQPAAPSRAAALAIAAHRRGSVVHAFPRGLRRPVCPRRRVAARAAAPRGGRDEGRRMKRFANPSVVCEGWYAVGAARAIRPGSVTRAWIGKRDIVVYREHSGALRAVDRACAHLGADLAHGTVVDKGLQCAFHRWCWAADGACAAGGGVAVGARIAAYELIGSWGMVWVWAW